MTATTTAHVEVLIAEVRVLMVGSRQVTLSVFRQLDHVRPGHIEPFGRVRDGAEDGWVQVVGRRAALSIAVPWSGPVSVRASRRHGRGGGGRLAAAVSRSGMGMSLGRASVLRGMRAAGLNLRCSGPAGRGVGEAVADRPSGPAMTCDHALLGIPEQRAVLRVNRAVLQGAGPETARQSAGYSACPECAVLVAVAFGIKLAEQLAAELARKLAPGAVLDAEPSAPRSST